jgi:hypothetical protein
VAIRVAAPDSLTEAPVGPATAPEMVADFDDGDVGVDTGVVVPLVTVNALADQDQLAAL